MDRLELYMRGVEKGYPDPVSEDMDGKYLRTLHNMQDWLRAEYDVEIIVFPIGEVVPDEETTKKYVYVVTNNFIDADFNVNDIHSPHYLTYDVALSEAILEALKQIP